jgi:YD repeat-containing protein
MKFFVLFLFVLLIASCKKDIDNTQFTGTPKVKTQTNGTTVITFTYDSEGRRSSAISSSRISNYIYSDTIVTVIDSTFGFSPDTTVYNFNADGLVVSDSHGRSYAYDDNQHCILQTDIRDSSRLTRFWSNDNMVAISFSNAMQTYTYLLNTYNTIGTDNTGISYYGKDSKNLIDTYTFSMNNNSTTYKYSYAYDSQKRIKQMTQSEVGSNWTSTYTYTYY